MAYKTTLFTCALASSLQVFGHEFIATNNQVPFWTHDTLDVDDEFSLFPYNGLNTFAAVPYANCFDKDDSEENRYDIAILGAPHDTVRCSHGFLLTANHRQTVTSRPGARYGPSGIRTATQSKAYGYDIFTGRDPLHDWATVVDCGDAPMTWLDNRAALRTLDRAHRIVSNRTSSHIDESPIPRIVMLGGDHTTTLSALRSTRKRWGKVSVIHFDSHIGIPPPRVPWQFMLILNQTHGTLLF